MIKIKTASELAEIAENMYLYSKAKVLVGPFEVDISLDAARRLMVDVLDDISESGCSDLEDLPHVPRFREVHLLSGDCVLVIQQNKEW